MSILSTQSAPAFVAASERAKALAERLEEGARALAAFANTLSDAEWRRPFGTTDQRKIGVIVHHVASIYPLEMQLAQAVANGQPITDVTWEVVAQVNAGHSKENDGVTKEAALDLLRKNSAAAASALRSFSDEELDRAAPASLYSEAPVTTQFVLEDHAVRHSYHHLARIRKAVKR